MFLKDVPILANVDIAFATHEHQHTIGTEVAVPSHDLHVIPTRVVLAQPFVADARQVSAQAGNARCVRETNRNASLWAGPGMYFEIVA